MADSNFFKFYRKGEVIFKQGDPGTCAYLIESGQVEVVLESEGNTTPVALLGDGDIFGEMAIIDGSDRSASAVAASPCQLIEVSKEQLNERVDEADPIVRFLITILMDRLRGSIGLMSPEELEQTHSQVINLNDFKKKAEVVEKIKFEKSMRAALENEEFDVHYQPILDFKTKKVAGFEALMRWNHPERGMVRPDIFMGIAEETSLIIPMGQWIIYRVTSDFAHLKNELRAAGKNTDNLFVSINIAAKQFNDKHLFNVLTDATKRNKLKPSEIKLEITERVLIGGTLVYDWIKVARKYGFNVALDDFGTGFSSLSYLANLEVNSLKIDKSFVDKMIKDEKSRNIVKFLVGLSKSLNLEVIAEGVEQQKEWAMLKDFGCDYMQGYLYSKPLPLTGILELLAPSRKKKAA